MTTRRNLTVEYDEPRWMRLGNRLAATFSKDIPLFNSLSSSAIRASSPL